VSFTSLWSSLIRVRRLICDVVHRLDQNIDRLMRELEPASPYSAGVQLDMEHPAWSKNLQVQAQEAQARSNLVLESDRFAWPIHFDS
jgi:hypothetical protein